MWTTGKVRLQVAQPQDLEVLVAMMRDSYLAEGRSFDDEARKKISELISNPKLGRAWLLSRRKEVIGFLIVSIYEGWDDRKLGVLVDEFYVHPRSYSEEICSIARDAVLRLCRELGVHVQYRKLGRQWYVLTTWI
jgi:hypothetical protein